MHLYTRRTTSATERLKQGELRVVRQCNRISQGRYLWRYFALVSRLGDGVFWYALMLALAVAGGRAGTQAALQMAVLGLASLLLYKLIKHWSKRPRPLAATTLTVRVHPLDEFSFPSGHTLHAVGFTWVATAAIPELGWVLWPFTASVAMSRVVLGLHYPSDVLVAVGLGIGLAEAVCAVLS